MRHPFAQHRHSPFPRSNGKLEPQFTDAQKEFILKNGRPLGTPGFIRKLEKKLDRPLKKGKPGLKPKAPADKRQSRLS